MLRRIRRLRTVPWPGAHRADALLAIGLFLWNVAELVVGPLQRGSWIAAVPTGALLTLPLARRRQAPLIVLLLVVAGYAGQVAMVGHRDSATLLLCFVTAVFSVAAHADLVPALAGLAVGGVPVWVFLAAHPTRDPVDVTPAEGVLLAVPWIAGRAVHQFRVGAQAAEQRAEAVERAALAEARLAATAERARIAREMHDVVSHAVSLMVVQAEAGDALFDSDPQRARRSFTAVQNAGRQAMSELRHMLGVLREERADDQSNGEPSLADLQALVDEVRDAGLPVDLDVVGEPVDLPSDLQACVYRTVQEGLTNALKHSAGGHACVTLRYDPDGIDVQVVDSGDHRPAESTGYGLLGVRERVARHGGHVTAGPQDSGGFVMQAHIPVGGS